jgi:hypothetical protein
LSAARRVTAMPSYNIRYLHEATDARRMPFESNSLILTNQRPHSNRSQVGCISTIERRPDTGADLHPCSRHTIEIPAVKSRRREQSMLEEAVTTAATTTFLPSALFKSFKIQSVHDVDVYTRGTMQHARTVLAGLLHKRKHHGSYTMTQSCADTYAAAYTRHGA